MLSSSWGVFFLPIFIFLGIGLYLTIAYFIRQYREAIHPEEKEEEEEKEEKEEEEEEEEEEGVEAGIEEEEEEVEAGIEEESDEDLLSAWTLDDDVFESLNSQGIFKETRNRGLFPAEFVKTWEEETGAYPDINDPEFLQKLLSKREFKESLQTTWKPTTDPCTDNTSFEVTAVQRFVTNFMSPKTPYMSALLFHGVGVGKTCAAVQIIEAWLEYYPTSQVYLVAPPTIQKGFLRTIFDITKVTIGEENEPNKASQCTGIRYMQLTNTLYEKDKTKIEKAVFKLVKRRYKIFGYISFSNYIRNKLIGIPDSISEEKKNQLKRKYIRDEFSGKLLIVDEAHNLRDITDESDKDEVLFAGGKAEKSDTEGGKMLTPYLRYVLQYAEGMKFCALTATPMYNTYKEIIFIINILLINDKKPIITESEVFNKDGEITEKGAQTLSKYARRYVSFMRGENPLSFPVRLFPNVEKIEEYPPHNPRNTPIPPKELEYHRHLPLVPIVLEGDSLAATRSFMDSLFPYGKGLKMNDLQKLVNASNCVVPATNETRGTTTASYLARTENNALSTVFNRQSVAKEIQFRAKANVTASWLAVGELKKYAPKFEFLINRIQNSEGCIFAYTRFINLGALPLALALEANGYTHYYRKSGLLADGIQAPGGRQCALCYHKEDNHPTTGAAGSSDHNFTPAYYGILTGDIGISPNNEETIKAQRDFANATGVKMKIIIGSQIASEGIDLRFIRETHVIDSWFHLNKTEQILGRAIRFLSHCALDKEKRNNTVYLYTAVLPNDPRETADLYSYRYGFKKAVAIGKVTRIMKSSALDCNLNKNAIIISGEESVIQIDSQGEEREVDINDMPFTAVCDWIETCDYTCNPLINIADLDNDESSYDEFAARWRTNKMKDILRRIFAEQEFYTAENIWNMFEDVPRFAVVQLLKEVINNKSFQIHRNNMVGYIRYCNGYYIFQPAVYTDLTIPLAVRVAKFPVRRDEYLPLEYEAQEYIEEIEEPEYNQAITLSMIWNSILGWVTQLSQSTKYILPPEEIQQKILRVVATSKQAKKDEYLNIIKIIRWFHTSFTKSPDPGRISQAFRKTVMLYLWDEWFTMKEQVELSTSGEEGIEECLEENKFTAGKNHINRFFDPTTKSLHYVYITGQEVTKSGIDYINSSKAKDPIQRTKINIKNTDKIIYGFIVPKTSKLILKTAKPTEDGQKLEIGSECGIVSARTGHMSTLIYLGMQLDAAGLSDFDLNNDMLYSRRKIQGSTNLCILMNLILRIMDILRISGVRWFYRPVIAYYCGHKGINRTGRE